jgi:aspartate ammonia-lyase
MSATPPAATPTADTRIERDSLGEIAVPATALYGVQTQRALENFTITRVPISHFPDLVAGLALVKQAAARANRELGALPADIAVAIDAACAEIVAGKHHAHFQVDMIQGGAGTSTNMNANEVIANLALQRLGHERGDYAHCHPNNHVNRSQSTNDVYPTAMKVALLRYHRKLVRVLALLIDSFAAKGEAFHDVLKMGRTQLQDAVPMTVGQEMAAWAETLREEIERLEVNARLFHEVNLGGTAIGTGLNADPRYATRAVAHLAELSGMQIVLAKDLVEATQDTGSFVMYASSLKRLAVKLSKISNDIRLLSSGPRAGFGELKLPAVQPGSTIMPGKVNPVIPEVVNQVCFKVIGNDLVVTLAAEAGQLQLNAFEPVIVQSLFESMGMLANAMDTLRLRCIDGLEVDLERTRYLVERSIGVVTALVPELGYDQCAELAHEALAEDRGILELVLERGLMDRERLEALLAPEGMLGR